MYKNNNEIYNDLDKEKCYCNKCFSEGKLTILEEDENNEGVLKIPNCGHYGRNYYSLQFIKRKGY